MQIFYWIIETAATLIENIIALSAVTAAGKPRFQGKKHFFAIGGLSALMAVIVSLLNSFQVFSFLTIAVCMAYVIAVSKLTSTGNVLTRSAACVILYFMIHTIDYILIFSIGLITESSAEAPSTFSLLLSPGPIRVVFLIINKAIDIAIYFLTKRVFSKLSGLANKYQGLLLFISLAVYCVMTLLLNAILQVYVLSVQTIAVALWLFICLCLFLVIAMFFIFDRYQEEKRTNKLFQTSNALMEENYRQLHKTQQAHARQLHDFKHHLLAIKGLASTGKQSDIGGYVDKLLETSYQEAAVCHSGNDTIDAIINCKAAEAGQENISFAFTASFPVRTNIDPTDLCGVLANQIDNALEACRELPDSGPREIVVEVYQNENFAFFRVENTVKGDPFENNPRLLSTKKDTSQLHGLGLKNIREIAEKYDGSLRNEYRNGRFLSVASLSFEPMEDFDGK